MRIPFDQLFIACLAFCITLIVLSGMRPIAIKVDLVDHPNTRKHHRGAIPLIGGLGIGIGFCIGMLALNISLSPYRALLAGYVLLIVIGLMDDFNELSPRLRIAAQLLVSILAVCWGNIVLVNLGHFYSSAALLSIGYWAIPLTIILIMALINANNMLDGLNGLAGGSSFVTLLCLYYIAIHSHASNDTQFILILLSCVLGFLCFNFPILRYRKRLVFLGDAGSTSLGLMLAWFGIKLAQAPYAFLKPAYLGWLFILPTFDLASVSLRRLLIKRSSPFAADREHIHHLLQSLGMRNSIATLFLLLLALAGGLAAIVMAQYQISEPLAIGAFMILFFIYFAGSSLYWYYHNKH